MQLYLWQPYHIIGWVSHGFSYMLKYIKVFSFFNFSGLIGQNWSMIFAGSGFNVVMFDVDPGQLERAKTNISSTLQRYEKDGLMRGSGTSTEQAGRISTSTSLEECLTGAFYIQVNHEIKSFKICLQPCNLYWICSSINTCMFSELVIDWLLL